MLYIHMCALLLWHFIAKKMKAQEQDEQRERPLQEVPQQAGACVYAVLRPPHLRSKVKECLNIYTTKINGLC